MNQGLMDYLLRYNRLRGEGKTVLQARKLAKKGDAKARKVRKVKKVRKVRK